MKKLFQALLSLLQVRATAAGLEISDQVVRLVYVHKKVWQMYATRLAPGVLEKGRINDRAALIAALADLKMKVQGRSKTKKMNVVFCVSSVEAYTQTFSLPPVRGEDFEKAVALNLQMASPSEAGEAYSGWQLIGREKDTPNLQILAVFIERKVVDEMVDVLFEAGFLVMAAESKALALMRVLREKGAGIDATKSYVFADIDNTGIDFIIIRNGILHFEYTNPWRDLMDGKGEISMEKFEATLAASIRQVVNFYNQHWPEPLAAIILSGVAFEARAEQVVAKTVPIPTARLTLVMGQPISPEWLTALGCSLHGSGLKAEEREISLLGEDSQDRFREEQFIRFMRFWSAITPVALALLVFIFIAADVFLANTKTAIESRSDVNIGGAQAAEITTLQASAKDFNRSVALVAAAEKAVGPKSILFGEIMSAANASHVTVNHLSFQSFSAPISLLGGANTKDAVLAFKAALENNPAFTNVDLPLTGVQAGGNTLSFSVTFQYTPSPTGSK